MPFAPATTRSFSRPVTAARRHFYAMGWSYRAAAPVLGVCYQHLSQVLNGERKSSSLLARIQSLPPRQP